MIAGPERERVICSTDTAVGYIIHTDSIAFDCKHNY